MVRASPGDDDEAGAQKRGKKVGIKGKNLADDILDFALAGPKMRRWYNEEEDEGLEAVKGPKRSGEDGEEEDEGPRSQVLVVGGDTAMGDAVIMQLILGREEVAAHVRNAEETRVKYGAFLPMRRALRSVCYTKHSVSPDA